jgi:3-oxoacyl-[acyl-carrier protein] reductase
MAQYTELSGRVALVTGACRGIGLAIARALSGQGCAVAMCDVADSDAMAVACEEVAQFGGQARAYRCDVRDSEAVGKTVDSVLADLGGLHLLINNAGVTADGVIWKLTDEQWCNVLSVNLAGTFKMMRAVAPVFRSQTWGRIVNISSINALRGKFGQANYAASKAGVIGLTLSAAREFAREGITVNAIAPGFIETDMTAELPEDIVGKAREESLLGRLGQPGDVASTVLFFCSDGAAHITGTVLRVDGGQGL